MLTRGRLALHGARRLTHAVGDVFQVLRDLSFERLRVLTRSGAHDVLGEFDLVLQACVANRFGRLAQLARRPRLIATSLARQPIGLGFELANVIRQRVFALHQLLHLLCALLARRGLRGFDVIGDFALTRLHLLSLLRELLNALVGGVGLAAFEIARCAVELLQGLAALRRRSGGCAPHGVGGLLHLSSGVGELRVVLLTRESFQSTRFFFGLLGEIALRATAASTPAVRATAVGTAARTAAAAGRTTGVLGHALT